MNGKNDRSRELAGLRWRAEEAVQAQRIRAEKAPSNLSHEEALRLVHELRVHQVELEQQYEELCQAQAEVSATRERYFDLYHLAPVGYFIISPDGRIVETNEAGVALLGVPRAALVKQPVTRFIFKEDQDIYYLHRRELLVSGNAHACELRLVKADGTPFWVRLTASMQKVLATSVPGIQPMTRVVLSDISEQKELALDNARLSARLKPTKPRPRVGPKVRKSRPRKKPTKKTVKMAAKNTAKRLAKR